MSKTKKEITVKDLLKKYKLYTTQIININYHLNVMWCEAQYLVFKVVGLTGLTEEELAKVLYELILKCDSNNPNYDVKIDEEMTRRGNSTDVFYGGRNHNKWNNGLFEDDGFGFGTEVTSIYDDYQDSDFVSRKK